MKVDLPDNIIKATRVALSKHYTRITDDNGRAVTCTQEMADSTYEALRLFEDLVHQVSFSSQQIDMDL